MIMYLDIEGLLNFAKRMARFLGMILIFAVMVPYTAFFLLKILWEDV